MTMSEDSESEGLQVPRLDPLPLPSSLTPGDRHTLSEIVGAIDRHTAAVNRMADAFDSIAMSVKHLADRAREFAEKTLPWSDQ
jgi:hypothetical protein